MLKVLEARDRRSIVVTTPTSVKSFMLKLVELLHKLDISRMQRAEQREDDTTTASHIRCRSQCMVLQVLHETQGIDFK